MNKKVTKKEKRRKVKLEEFINIERDENEVNLMSPLVWAYVGDCVYELYIRTELINKTNLKPHKLNNGKQ